MTITTIMVDELPDENDHEYIVMQMYYRRQKLGISEYVYQCMIREIEEINYHGTNYLKVKGKKRTLGYESRMKLEKSKN